MVFTGEFLLRLFPTTSNTLLIILSVWLARRYPQPFARSWSMAFLSGGVALACDLVGKLMNRPWPFTLIGLVGVAFFIRFLFEAGYRLRGLANQPRWLDPALFVSLAASVVMIVAGVKFEMVVLPLIVLDVCSLLWLGATLLRLPAFGDRFAQRMLGWSLVSDGLLTLAYPFFANASLDWLGYWCDGALLLIIAVASMLFLYEINAQQLRLLINESRHHAFLLLDKKSRVASWNEGAQRLFGYAREDIFGHAGTELGPEPHGPWREDTASERVGWCLGAGGARFWGHATVTPIFDSQKKLQGFSMLVRDGTEKRAIEEERARLAEALRQSDDAVAITDPQGAVRYLNPAFERNCGKRAAAALGKPIDQLMGAPAEGLDTLREALRRGEGWIGQLRIPAVPEDRLEEVHLSPIRRDGVLSDFLVRKRDVTRELALQERLYQSQKTESIGRLAGGVAHDFGNLLAIIVSYTHLLEEGDPSHTKSSLAAIRRATDRATALVQDLMDFGSRRPVRPQVLDLNQLVSHVNAMLRRLIGEHIELLTRLGPYLGHVKADPGQIEQVITNLVVNARDAMPEGGVITVETINADVLEQQGDVPPGRYVCLSVTDTGHGMDSAVLKRALEPFFTTKSIGQGSGLGLAIVDGIVQGSGGYIRIESEKVKGTCFRIYLPSHDAPIDRPVLADSSLRANGQRSETLLVVEDEPELGEAMASILRKRGYRVLLASSGEEAVNLFEKHADIVDLVISDVVMPKMNGRLLATALHYHRPDLKFLFMPGFPDGEKLIAEISSGVAFLQKPFTPEQLSSAVRNTLATAKLDEPEYSPTVERREDAQRC
jgi:PAS domain S-box-containing protein